MGAGRAAGRACPVHRVAMSVGFSFVPIHDEEDGSADVPQQGRKRLRSTTTVKASLNTMNTSSTPLVMLNRPLPRNRWPVSGMTGV